MQAGEPRDLPEHLARLTASARMMDFEVPDDDAWLRGVEAVLGAGGETDLTLRLVATRGPAGGSPTCFVTGAPVAETVVRQRTEGVAVLLLDRGYAASEAVAAPWLLTGAKTLSYAVNMAALRHAHGNGADDVIFVGSDGAVLEGATSTVVVLRDRTLLTPPLNGVLETASPWCGLIRAAQADGWAAAYQPLTPDDLNTADGVFLVSSVRLVTPVVSIDGDSTRGPGAGYRTARPARCAALVPENLKGRKPFPGRASELSWATADTRSRQNDTARS